MVFHEGLLHWVQCAVGICHALDGSDLFAISLRGKDGAALDSLAVEMDGTGAARRRVAADVGAGEPGVFTDVVDEQRAWLDIMCLLCAIDVDRNFHGRSPRFVLCGCTPPSCLIWRCRTSRRVPRPQVLATVKLSATQVRRAAAPSPWVIVTCWRWRWRHAGHDSRCRDPAVNRGKQRWP